MLADKVTIPQCEILENHISVHINPGNGHTNSRKLRDHSILLYAVDTCVPYDLRCEVHPGKIQGRGKCKADGLTF